MKREPLFNYPATTHKPEKYMHMYPRIEKVKFKALYDIAL